MGHACAGKEGKWRYGSNPFPTTVLDGVGVGGQYHPPADLPTRKDQVHILEEDGFCPSFRLFAKETLQ
jgi:hypothetical protein